MEFSVHVKSLSNQDREGRGLSVCHDQHYVHNRIKFQLGSVGENHVRMVSFGQVSTDMQIRFKRALYLTSVWFFAVTV